MVQDDLARRARQWADDVLAWVGQDRLADLTPRLADLRTDAPDESNPLGLIRQITTLANSSDEQERGAGLGALFGGVVEALNDQFTPASRAAYARFFGHAIWQTVQGDEAMLTALARFGIEDEAGLLDRHASVRSACAEPFSPPTAPCRIAVLSRVTLGADILITSVLLQHLHRRWPEAELCLIGTSKLTGLFAGLPRVRICPLNYARRGGLAERLRTWLPLLHLIEELDVDLVCNPDSRLDQLGLLPVIDSERFLLWENLQPEQTPARSFAELIDGWATARFASSGPTILPRIAFDPHTRAQESRCRSAFGSGPLLAVKLDHGGNPAKALPRRGELAILQAARDQGWRILLDRGFGEEELANSDHLLETLGWQAVDIDDTDQGVGLPVEEWDEGLLADAQLIRFHGSIAGWAAALRCCQAALSYDSVGHHLAAALDVPLVTAFTGFAQPDFAVAWQPRGSTRIDLVTIPTAERDEPRHWQRVIAALGELLPTSS